MKKNKLEKIWTTLKIVQVADNQQRVRDGLPELGRGYSEAYRLNPYNPLCYLILPILLVWAAIAGVKKGFELLISVPDLFKWS